MRRVAIIEHNLLHRSLLLLPFGFLRLVIDHDLLGGVARPDRLVAGLVGRVGALAERVIRRAKSRALLLQAVLRGRRPGHSDTDGLL